MHAEPAAKLARRLAALATAEVALPLNATPGTGSLSGASICVIGDAQASGSYFTRAREILAPPI